MSDEEIAEYALELRELKVNSKPIITSLTMLAARSRIEPAAADAIAGVVEKRIRTSEPKLKLTALYLLDSIAKNIGGHYVARFAAKPRRRLAAHAVADEPTRKSMARLFTRGGPSSRRRPSRRSKLGFHRARSRSRRNSERPARGAAAGPRPPPPLASEVSGVTARARRNLRRRSQTSVRISRRPSSAVGTFPRCYRPSPPPRRERRRRRPAAVALRVGRRARRASPAQGTPGRPSGLSVADPSGVETHRRW